MSPDDGLFTTKHTKTEWGARESTRMIANGPSESETRNPEPDLPCDLSAILSAILSTIALAKAEASAKQGRGIF